MWDGLCEPHSNHGAKPCCGHTEDEERRLTANQYGKSSDLSLTHTHTRARESERNKRITEQSENNKMATVSSHLSIITLNVNAFSSSIEMHRVAEWIKKNKTQLYVS